MVTTAALLDVLYGLFEAEEGSLFRFMREGSPYLTRATVETRREIETMAETSVRHAAEIAALIEQFGGSIGLAAVHPGNQYLSYLSLKFLIPKLADAKRRMLERYENALRALKDAPVEVLDLLKRHIDEHRRELTSLEANEPREYHHA
jgi:hypothetical protein